MLLAYMHNKKVHETIESISLFPFIFLKDNIYKDARTTVNCSNTLAQHRPTLVARNVIKMVHTPIFLWGKHFTECKLSSSIVEPRNVTTVE